MRTIRQTEPSLPPRTADPVLRAELRRAIEQQIVPRLLSLHERPPAAPELHAPPQLKSGQPELVQPDLVQPDLVQPGSWAAGGVVASGMQDFSARLSVELAMDSVGPTPERVGARLDRLLDGGADPQELCVQVLAPAARYLGQLWVEDRLDFVDVTLGTMRLERALRGLLAAAPTRRAAALSSRPPSILLMPLPGNQHTFGLSMAVELFRRAGWVVSDASAFSLPASPQGQASDGLDGLERHLRCTRLDAIGLAVSCETQSERLTRALRMIRASSANPRIRIALGGPLFLVQPGMASRFDADLVVTDGARAPSQLTALLPDADGRRQSPGAAATALT